MFPRAAGNDLPRQHAALLPGMCGGGRIARPLRPMNPRAKPAVLLLLPLLMPDNVSGDFVLERNLLVGKQTLEQPRNHFGYIGDFNLK